MHLIPLPQPLYVKHYGETSKPEQAQRLAIRLLKFCDTETPPAYKKKGEQWGEGQIHINGFDGKIYRGQIALPDERRAYNPWVYNPKEKDSKPIPPEVLTFLPFNYPTLPDGHPRPEGGGLRVSVKCLWIVQKPIGVRTDQWGIRTSTWQWEYIPSSTCLVLPIRRFYQNKSYQRDGILHPKRLFFETDRGERGYFAQRHDAENIHSEDGVFTDPLHPSV